MLGLCELFGGGRLEMASPRPTPMHAISSYRKAGIALLLFLGKLLLPASCVPPTVRINRTFL